MILAPFRSYIIQTRHCADFGYKTPPKPLFPSTKVPELISERNPRTICEAIAGSLTIELVEEEKIVSKMLQWMGGSRRKVNTLFNQRLCIQITTLVLDLLDDDNKETNCRGRAVPETHVAFSVGGLGKVRMETPAHSPRTQKRSFASPPRVTRHIRNSTNSRSMSYDLGIELNGDLYDVNKIIDRDSAKVFCKRKSTTYEKGNRKNMRFIDSYIYSDVLDDHSDCLGTCDKNFQDNRNELWESSNDLLDNDFPGISDSDAEWEKKSSNSVRASIPSNPNISGIYECSSGDFTIDSSRFGAKQKKKSGNSAKGDPLFNLSALDKECNLSPEKDPSVSNFWSFTQKENLADGISSLSEESCSSTAVREDKNCDFYLESKTSHLDELDMNLMNLKEIKKSYLDELDLSLGVEKYASEEEKGYDLYSHPAKLKESKTSHLDELDMSLMNLKEIKKKYMDELDTSLGAGDYKRTSKQLDPKASYGSKVSCVVQKISDPDCIFSFKEELSSEFTLRRSRSNIHVDHGSSSDFSFKNNISRDLSEGLLPYSFASGDDQNGIQMPESVRQRDVCMDNRELGSTSTKLESKFLSEKSLYSQNDGEISNKTPSECQELNKRINKSSSVHKPNDPPEEAESPRKREVSGIQTYISEKV
ncbi:hypothetical protein Cni_G23549 [Canna indica]|uniref:Uncharacterized protein n=1 Tax=Canna indica TaxID=4628 RepID=A0AAQ3KXE8_9LILI|nr:hypothetical protein Cni_G23549 [Canna indica]